ncbi:MAG: diaminopimelate epimerase [Proteobacteria bacterium]|nr:diaminopimelate epimerase [Pseudomonadota bacterium]MBI3496475.1 diaminopimelate epimerase [Pseudomonadota bacterium]
MDGLPFIKMHGLGNDFVVVDARQRAFALDPGAARRIADRHTGVGCDQLIVIEPARANLADAFMRIVNADGGEVEACGNATRCVADLIMREKSVGHVVIETGVGLLDAEAAADGLVSVDMGPARFDWRDIPLATAADPLHLEVTVGPLKDGVAVNIGNPHAVFFVADAQAIDLAAFGPVIERHTLFPERTNVEVVQALGADRLRMRVWERGVGITRACGTGACAAVVAASRRGMVPRRAEVVLDGGVLAISWERDNHVIMTGPVAVSFTGTLAPDMVGRAAP